MKKILRCSFEILMMVFILAGSLWSQEDKLIILFDGKSMAGWKPESAEANMKENKLETKLTKPGEYWGTITKDVSFDITEYNILKVDVEEVGGRNSKGWYLFLNVSGKEISIQRDTMKTGVFTYNLAEITKQTGRKNVSLHLGVAAMEPNAQPYLLVNSLEILTSDFAITEPVPPKIQAISKEDAKEKKFNVGGRLVVNYEVSENGEGKIWDNGDAPSGWAAESWSGATAILGSGKGKTQGDRSLECRYDPVVGTPYYSKFVGRADWSNKTEMIADVYNPNSYPLDAKLVIQTSQVNFQELAIVGAIAPNSWTTVTFDLKSDQFWRDDGTQFGKKDKVTGIDFVQRIYFGFGNIPGGSPKSFVLLDNVRIIPADANDSVSGEARFDLRYKPREMTSLRTELRVIKMPEGNAEVKLDEAHFKVGDEKDSVRTFFKEDIALPFNPSSAGNLIRSNVNWTFYDWDKKSALDEDRWEVDREIGRMGFMGMVQEFAGVDANAGLPYDTRFYGFTMNRLKDNTHISDRNLTALMLQKNFEIAELTSFYYRKWGGGEISRDMVGGCIKLSFPSFLYFISKFSIRSFLTQPESYGVVAEGDILIAHFKIEYLRYYKDIIPDLTYSWNPNSTQDKVRVKIPIVTNLNLITQASRYRSNDDSWGVTSLIGRLTYLSKNWLEITGQYSNQEIKQKVSSRDDYKRQSDYYLSQLRVMKLPITYLEPLDVRLGWSFIEDKETSSKVYYSKGEYAFTDEISLLGSFRRVNSEGINYDNIYSALKYRLTGKRKTFITLAFGKRAYGENEFFDEETGSAGSVNSLPGSFLTEKMLSLEFKTEF